MKALVITPKNQNEFKFLLDLLKKLNVMSSTVTQTDLEDLGLSRMLQDVDMTKKVSKDTVMKKLLS